MKFETTSALDGDYRRLKREHAVAFKTVVREKFAPACDAHAKDPTTMSSKSLRPHRLPVRLWALGPWLAMTNRQSWPGCTRCVRVTGEAAHQFAHRRRRQLPHALPTAADNDPNSPPHTARRIDQKESTDEHHHAALLVPNSWQPGGPITLASDKLCEILTNLRRASDQ